MTSPGQQPSRDRRPQWLLLLLALLLVPLCIWSFFANVGLGEAEGFIPAPLRSAALANYAQDPLSARMQNLSIRIIEFAIKDRDPEAADAEARATEVIESLQSPVPSVTPKSGVPTSTPVGPSSVPPTATPASSATPTPTLTPSRTPSRTPSPTSTQPATAGPSPTASLTPSPGPSATASLTPTAGATATPCKVAPHIEIIAPSDGQHFTLAQDLPGEAFAFDPDNANPATCAITPPGTNGQGIPVTATPTPAVQFYVERWTGVTWVQVHYQPQNTPAYCAFTGTPVCDLHDLGSGQWPDSTPIQTGLHRLKARVVRDDEGVASSWVSVEFYIDPIPTATPTATSTPTPTPTATNTVTPSPTADLCAGIALTGFNKSGQDAWWQLGNGPLATITINQVELTWLWPPDLSTIYLQFPTNIWNGDLASPANITGGWSGTTGDRQIAPSSSKELRFTFESGSPSVGYSLTVHFTNGCDASFNN